MFCRSIGLFSKKISHGYGGANDSDRKDILTDHEKQNKNTAFRQCFCKHGLSGDKLYFYITTLSIFLSSGQ